MLQDALRRPLGSLRISVTDRCNLRCRYCMPEDDYVWLPRESILSFEEIARLAGVFGSLGARKLRITGGEPLLRHDLPRLIAMLRPHPAVDDLAMTTNGMLLERDAPDLAAAGLDRLTISLDTLRPDRFKQFARSARHRDVLAGIEAAHRAGFTGTKLNAVIIRGFNDDELLDLLEFGRERDMEVRFIEYMDVGGATRWSRADVVSRAEMLQRIGARYGPVRVAPKADPRAPADRFLLPGGAAFGIIASTTSPFCRTCDRSRITADGMWFLCLYAVGAVDLKDRIRSGATDDELRAVVTQVWQERRDRGAEERLAAPERGPLYRLEGLRADPHREMHTRGG